MSFSYNENLSKEENARINEDLASLSKESIVAYIQDTARKLMTETVLFQEFKHSFDGFDYSFKVEDEHLKNFFIIGLNGIQKVWERLVCPNHGVLPYPLEPLQESVFTYLESLTDGLEFGELFKKELTALNHSNMG